VFQECEHIYIIRAVDKLPRYGSSGQWMGVHAVSCLTSTFVQC